VADNPSAYGEVFNIGHHQHESLLEIGHAVVTAAGSGEVVSTPWPEDRARIAIDSYWTDHSKATSMLDWQPTWSLSDGLAATLEHYRSSLAWRA
jgi:nucleoside-diphosphate-sugar epimerase